MNNHTHMTLAQQLSAAQEWWRGAGVDYDYLDEAQAWLKDIEPEGELVARPAAKSAAKIARQATAPPPAPMISRADLPDTLEAFHTWWSDPESKIPGAPGLRIAPRGTIGAKMMLVVPEPEPGDTAQLLSGAQGRLIANILRALGLAQDSAYLASALTGPMTEPDWASLHQQGLGTILAQHIALAKPERVVLLGTGLPILLGHGVDAPPEDFTKIDSSAGKLPLLATFAPDRLLGHARQRARLWQRLLNWME